VAFDPDFGRVVPSNVKLTVGDGWRLRRVGTPQQHLHQGLDIALPQGTPILAVADGTVTFVAPTDSSDAGIFVAISHPSGLVTRYLHLSRALVQRGQVVRKGQEIGKSGSTGLSEGPHLHFEVNAPTAMLPLIIATVGRPVTGFGPGTSFGNTIPAEPWLPVDEYRPAVVSSAREMRIPLFLERPRSTVAVAPSSESSKTGKFVIGALATGGFLTLAWLAWRVGRLAAIGRT
jgi:murein DD-endopeptidase MepM/ murein hydrolase activator NlpD